MTSPSVGSGLAFDAQAPLSRRKSPSWLHRTARAAASSTLTVEGSCSASSSRTMRRRRIQATHLLLSLRRVWASMSHRVGTWPSEVALEGLRRQGLVVRDRGIEPPGMSSLGRQLLSKPESGPATLYWCESWSPACCCPIHDPRHGAALAQPALCHFDSWPPQVCPPGVLFLPKQPVSRRSADCNSVQPWSLPSDHHSRALS